MKERRKSKGIKDEYKTPNTAVQRRIKKSKEEYLAAQCEDRKMPEKKFDSFLMHEKAKKKWKINLADGKRTCQSCLMMKDLVWRS